MTRILFAAAIAIAGIVPSHAQTWPTRPITLIVPFAAGGPVDTIARILAARMSETLKQQIVIENIGGAGGMTGAARVAKAAPDGYQFVLGGASTHAVNQTLYKKPLYNAATDFAPVALVVEQPIVLVTRKELPVGNLAEFIAYAKANQAKMQYGSGGAGSTPHLACALLNAAIGVMVTHVPYRGTGPATQDMIAGRIDYQCPLGATAIPQIASDKIKPIAILTRNRSPIVPSLASAHEQGLVDFEASTWNAAFLPKGTPAAIVAKLNAAIVATMETPAVQERLRDIGATVVAPERRTPDYLGQFVAREIEKWAVPIRAANISEE